ncbi:hypothetical protein B2G71_04865 [Novosphingobium sp. PC22D]|uniref:gluconate 2-dehydrogenase subunit 3 family protein n=1 Tax=Novosphingobium sp. PC22D TaxID=1962403 RepID=UPI000BEFEE6A|nr:gluconate 2-dehydrogenase subunit 3 family protein [Novosphingobium sp. PC22D]PEQ13660.1 hypothetical protein B2G71_04865 [Novosphingobium sp. PC22D]
MADRYAHYDVLDKRDTPSWNDKTRQVIDARMSLREADAGIGEARLATLRRLVSRIAPQPERHAPANTVALLAHKIVKDEGEGFRPATLPRLRECWLRGLDAIEAEAQARHGRAFAGLDAERADALLRGIEAGETQASDWIALPARDFWNWRVIPDIVSMHWSHPSLWSAMGFGGPASPRGYVRLDVNRRDPWEAEEHGDG